MCQLYLNTAVTKSAVMFVLSWAQPYIQMQREVESAVVQVCVESFRCKEQEDIISSKSIGEPQQHLLID